MAVGLGCRGSGWGRRLGGCLVGGGRWWRRLISLVDGWEGGEVGGRREGGGKGEGKCWVLFLG